MGGAHPDQLVKFDLDRSAVAVLRILDKIDHQKSHNARTRVYDQLPRIRVIEERSRHCPDHDAQGGDQKRGSASSSLRHLARDIAKKLRKAALFPRFVIVLLAA